MRVTVGNAVCALNKINRGFPLDLVCLGGDNVGNYPGSPEEHIDMMRELSGFLSELEMPWVCAQGNHDDNSIHGRLSGESTRVRTGTEVPDEKQFEIFMSHQLGYNNFTPSDVPGALYGFMDFPEKKIRVIILNGDEVPHIVGPDGILRYSQQWDYGYSGGQLSWLCEKALSVSDGTRVITVEHIPFPGGFKNDNTVHNGDVLGGILKAFKSGGKYEKKITEGDFPCDIHADFKAPGDIIALICGHIHNDLHGTFDGTLHISSACAARDSAGLAKDEDGKSLPKTPFSENETGFDIFCVDTKNRTVNAVRYGVGHDRTMKY